MQNPFDALKETEAERSARAARKEAQKVYGDIASVFLHFKGLARDARRAWLNGELHVARGKVTHVKEIAEKLEELLSEIKTEEAK